MESKTLSEFFLEVDRHPRTRANTWTIW